MARKPDISQFKTFEEVTGRLDEIVDAVRDKDLSLERSLDLFDEAIALGSKAVDLVDTTEFSAEELEHMAELDASGQGAEPAPEAEGEDGGEPSESAEQDEPAESAEPDAEASEADA